MTQVNEGFWDAIVNGAKRGALAVGAVAGSSKADGKLTALNLATKFYDEFNRFKGETGVKGSPDTMKEFMVNKLGLSQDFSDKAGVEFERFLKSPATYPNTGNSPMGDKPKNYNDGELRKYFLKVAQVALRSGAAKDAAKSELSQSNDTQNTQTQPTQDQKASEPTQAPAPEPAATQPQAATNSEPVDVRLQGINLNTREQELLNQIETQVGIEGLAQSALTTDDPEVKGLAKKIILQALRDYRQKVGTKKK